MRLQRHTRKLINLIPMFTSVRRCSFRMRFTRRLFLFPVIVIILTIVFVIKNLNREHVKNYMLHDDEVRPVQLHRIPRLGPGVITLIRKDDFQEDFLFLMYSLQLPTTIQTPFRKLEDNAIALNMVVDSVNSEIDKTVFTLVGHNETHEVSTVTTIHMDRIESCRYATVVAFTNTVGNLTKLEIDSDGVRFEVPFKEAPKKVPKPVVFCISPQAVAEKWQLFIMQVQMAKRFGAHIHLYIISMVESYFELVTGYEKEGYISIDPWLKMKISETSTPYFEFISNTAYANRAGAYTDCLLRYKDTVKYVAFLDMEDFIFPVMQKSYLREFNAEFSFKKTASSISYFHTIDTLKPVGGMRSGIVVVKPSRHNFTGISGNIHDEMESRYNVGDNWVVKSPHDTYSNKTIEESSSIIRPKKVTIDENVLNMGNLSSIQETFQNLPRFDFYAPIISKCLEATLEKSSCPNIESCHLPQRETFGCVHSSTNYFSSPPMKPFTFHFMNNSFWSTGNECHQ